MTPERSTRIITRIAWITGTSKERLEGLPPSVDGRARLLVLGSFPSAASIAASCYYAHPRNHFWPILSAAWGEPFPETPGERPEWALAHALAIWDSLDSCIRPGSLDGDIRAARPNDVAGLLLSWPLVERVLLNGRTSERYFRAGLAGPDAKIALRDEKNARKGSLEMAGGRTVAIRYLPSTSPVPSREFRRMEDKLPLWIDALKG